MRLAVVAADTRPAKPISCRRDMAAWRRFRRRETRERLDLPGWSQKASIARSASAC